MNIYILNKEKFRETTLEKIKGNNLFYNTNKMCVFEILKLKKEKDIQVILTKSKNNIFNILIEYFTGISVYVLKNDNDEKDLEKQLQNKIAYKRQKDIPVLMYHRVISSEEEKGTYDTYVTKENFEKQMKYLKDNNYNIITFKDIENGEYKNRFDKNKKYVIVTFDDGYKDNYINVLPILRKYSIKIVLYLVTDLQYNEWDVNVDNKPKEKRFELMTLEERRKIFESGLVELGGHTTKHLDMPKTELDILIEDLKISKEKLEELTGDKIISFAYPWGRSDVNTREIIKQIGYKFAVSTDTGSPCFSDDLFRIVRVGIYSKDDMKKFQKKVSGNYPFMWENRRKMKEVRNKIRKILGIKIK